MFWLLTQHVLVAHPACSGCSPSMFWLTQHVLVAHPACSGCSPSMFWLTQHVLAHPACSGCSPSMFWLLTQHVLVEIWVQLNCRLRYVHYQGCGLAAHPFKSYLYPSHSPPAATLSDMLLNRCYCDMLLNRCYCDILLNRCYCDILLNRCYCDMLLNRCYCAEHL